MRLESYRSYGVGRCDAFRILPRSWAVYEPLSSHNARYRLAASLLGKTALRPTHGTHPLPPNSQRTSSFLVEDELISRQDSEGETRLLVVNDEPNIRDLLAFSLHFAGFEVSTTADGHSVYHQTIDESLDLIVPDIILPDMDDFAVTRRLREAGIQVPVLFLTTRGNMRDKIQRLTIGRGDYVTKPFGPEEVAAHIRVILRRTLGAEGDDGLLRVGDLVIDEGAHEVTRAGVSIDLSPTEFKLLRYLVINGRRVVSKMQILGHVWEYDWDGEAAVMESCISYLRRELTVEDASGELTHTKRGIGYILRAED